MNFFEQIEFIVLGFVLVLAVLSMLALLTAFIGVIFKKCNKGNDKGDPQIPGTSQMDQKKVAVIAAAASTVIDQPHRIVSIQ